MGEVIEGVVIKRCDVDGHIHVQAEWGEYGRIAGWKGRLIWYRPAGSKHGYDVV